MSQIRFTASYGAEFQHESVVISHALLAATKKMWIIAAILPGPWHPDVLAKQIVTINHLTGGRVAVNIVSGWFRSESLQQQPYPEIFRGGSSRAARDMASRVSDWYFTNGNTGQGIQAQMDDIRTKAAANNHTVKIGVNAFIIAKDDPEAVNAFGHEVKNAGKASPEDEGNWAKSTFEDLVQYNDGFKTPGTSRAYIFRPRIHRPTASCVYLMLIRLAAAPCSVPGGLPSEFLNSAKVVRPPFSLDGASLYGYRFCSSSQVFTR